MGGQIQASHRGSSQKKAHGVLGRLSVSRYHEGSGRVLDLPGRVEGAGSSRPYDQIDLNIFWWEVLSSMFPQVSTGVASTIIKVHAPTASYVLGQIKKQNGSKKKKKRSQKKKKKKKKKS